MTKAFVLLLVAGLFQLSVTNNRFRAVPLNIDRFKQFHWSDNGLPVPPDFYPNIVDMINSHHLIGTVEQD
ncbi:unnamed protein product, partial [Rotaria sp. Silwood1]